jgi:hypothetical protein
MPIITAGIITIWLKFAQNNAKTLCLRSFGKLSPQSILTAVTFFRHHYYAHGTSINFDNATIMRAANMALLVCETDLPWFNPIC